MSRRRRSRPLSSGPTIIDLMDEPSGFAPWFAGESWWPWRVFLKALFGLPMTEAEVLLFQRCTGRTRPPTTPAREAWLICGRRAGKSRISAAIALYLAVFRSYAHYLAPGERPMVMCLAADRDQADVLLGYINGLLDVVPALAGVVQRRLKSGAILLTNGIRIQVQTASFRTVRGRTVVCAICDEVAYWRSEDSSANPDREVVAALRPAKGTLERAGALLLGISSPYARRGELWNAWRRHWARDDDPVLVWKADTVTMNPTFDEAIIAEAYAEDAEAAKADYGAIWRSDLEEFVTRELVDAAVVDGRRELPPVKGQWPAYQAFCDPASGTGADSMALALAHSEKGKAVLDVLLVAEPPFNFEQVVGEFSDVLRRYKVRKVVGDNWAKGWPAKEFKAHDITYEIADKPKGDIYLELLPLLTSRRIELLDHPTLKSQLLGLERRRGFAGRDKVDHGTGPHDHDDAANAAAGALVLAAGARRGGFRIGIGGTIRIEPVDVTPLPPRVAPVPAS